MFNSKVDNRSDITKLPQMTKQQKIQERKLIKRNSKVKKIKRQRTSTTTTKPLIEPSEENKTETTEVLDEPKKLPKFGFGVAYQISRLMVKLRRSSIDRKEISTVVKEPPKSPTKPFPVIPPINYQLLNPKWTADDHPHSQVMPLPNINKPLVKTRSSNALMIQGSTNLREQALQKQNSWGQLRNRIINAKISDVLSNIKFTVNGHLYRALR